MVDDCAGLVMFNPDGLLSAATVTRLLDKPGNDVLRALQPFKTDNGGGAHSGSARSTQPSANA
jgi:hypothetical protein